MALLAGVTGDSQTIHKHLGSTNLIVVTLTGDASDVTYNTGFTTIFAAWSETITDSNGARVESWAEGTVTFDTAPGNTETLRLFVLGS